MREHLIFLLAFLIGNSVFAGDKTPKKKSITQLPDIEVYDIHGKYTSLGILGKNKVTIIDNWFIPCPPCFREMGMLHQLYFKYRSNKNVDFITICRTDTGIVKKFLARNKSMATFVEWYTSGSKRSDFKLPIYFLPGCNEKIYTGKQLASYAPDDRTKCSDVQFGFKGYPTLMVFDKKGRLIFKKTGYSLREEDETRNTSHLKAIIESAIAK
jgi:thiol-disulfide isomerase/thioredoxin